MIVAPLFEVAVYVAVPAPCQREDAAPNTNAGEPLGVIVTVCVAVLGPFHPVAVTVITDVPNQPVV